jgi:glycosyltransferase involved in cell wall biosynthesis
MRTDRDPARPRLLVLVPHEPTLDPRVHYTAASLATRYSVTMLATVQKTEERPKENQPHASYSTERIPYRKDLGALRMALSFPALWLGSGRRPRTGCTTSNGSVLGGLRLALSVLRFTFQANDLLYRRAVGVNGAPAVIYCHDLYCLQAGVMLKRRWGARLVYDSHEYYPYRHLLRGFTRAIAAYEAALVGHVDAHITVSPQLASELERIYGAGAVHAIPNVEPVPHPRPSVPTSEMSRLADGRLKVLYQGTFAEGRGLEEVLQEWMAVDGTRIALFLRGPRSAWREQLERRAEELGLLGKSVYLLPPVLEKDLIGAAQEADIGLVPYKGDLPSYRFACPNKLSQYLHAGLAILANRIPYVEQVVTHGQAGLCYDIDQAGSFARTVDALTSDRSAIERFRRNALEFGRREYNWEQYEATLLALVEPGR